MGNEIAIDENFLKVAHIPYHLFSRHEGKALIAHLARFTLDSADQQYEVVERITTIEDENGEIMQKTNQVYIGFPRVPRWYNSDSLPKMPWICLDCSTVRP